MRTLAIYSVSTVAYEDPDTNAQRWQAAVVYRLQTMIGWSRILTGGGIATPRRYPLQVEASRKTVRRPSVQCGSAADAPSAAMLMNAHVR